MAADPEPVYTQSWTTAGWDLNNFMSGFSYTSGNAYASFNKDNTPWKKLDAASDTPISGSFTMVLDLKNSSVVYTPDQLAGNSTGQDIFSIQFGDSAERNLELQVQGGTDAGLKLVEDVQTSNTTTTSTTLTLDRLSSWTTITLIADWEQQQLSLYAGSDLVGRIENWTTTDAKAMTGIQFGSQLDGGGSGVSMSNTIQGEMLINNVAIYNGAQYQLVPEPATATLSLLALAGLCARRRRQAA